MKFVFFFSVVILLLSGCSSKYEHDVINDNIATVIQNQNIMQQSINDLKMNDEILNKNLNLVQNNLEQDIIFYCGG